MSAKIRVSYQDQKELELVIRLLRPAMKSYKIAGNTMGKYKKAYVILHEK